MQGKIETGSIEFRCEVVPVTGGGYKGILAGQGIGFQETPVVSEKASAQILLDNLRERVLPKAKTSDGISDKQRDVFREALATGIADHKYAVAV